MLLLYHSVHNVDIPKQCLLLLSIIKEMPSYGIGNIALFYIVVLGKGSEVYSKIPHKMKMEKCLVGPSVHIGYMPLQAVNIESHKDYWEDLGFYMHKTDQNNAFSLVHSL